MPHLMEASMSRRGPSMRSASSTFSRIAAPVGIASFAFPTGTSPAGITSGAILGPHTILAMAATSYPSPSTVLPPRAYPSPSTVFPSTVTIAAATVLQRVEASSRNFGPLFVSQGFGRDHEAQPVVVAGCTFAVWIFHGRCNLYTILLPVTATRCTLRLLS